MTYESKKDRAEKDLLDAQDLIQAIERSHLRTNRLIEQLHNHMARMVNDYGGDVGISPNVVAPKEPPK